MALAFAVGSACFLIGPFPGYASLVGDRADAIPFFVGFFADNDDFIDIEGEKIMHELEPGPEPERPAEPEVETTA